MELRMTTSTRLKTCLYSFTSPGGPMYPTRAVRHAAWESLDLLFPVSIFIWVLVFKPNYNKLQGLPRNNISCRNKFFHITINKKVWRRCYLKYLTLIKSFLSSFDFEWVVLYDYLMTQNCFNCQYIKENIDPFERTS